MSEIDYFAMWILIRRDINSCFFKSTRVILLFSLYSSGLVIIGHRSWWSFILLTLLFFFVRGSPRAHHSMKKQMKYENEEFMESVSLHKLSKTTMNTESTVPQQASTVVPSDNDRKLNMNFVAWRSNDGRRAVSNSSEKKRIRIVVLKVILSKNYLYALYDMFQNRRHRRHLCTSVVNLDLNLS